MRIETLKQWRHIIYNPILAGFVVTTTVFLISLLYHPADHPTFTICPFKTFTGMDCPGCGLTRAFCALAKGEFHRALQFHLLSPLFFGLFGVWWVYCVLHLVGKEHWARQLAYPFTRRPLIISFTVLLVVTWILRLTHLVS